MRFYCFVESAYLFAKKMFSKIRENILIGKQVSLLTLQVFKNSRILIHKNPPIPSLREVALRRRTRQDLLKVTGLIPLIILPGTAIILPVIFWKFPILHPSTLSRVDSLFKRRVEISNSLKSIKNVDSEVDALKFLGYKFPSVLPSKRFLRWVDLLLEEDKLIVVKDLDEIEMVECLMERG